MKASAWLLFVVSLPGPNKTARMRLWRAMRSSGAVALRDGAYLLPVREETRALLAEHAAHVVAEGGNGRILAFRSDDVAQDDELAALFDRGSDYAALLERIHAIQLGLDNATPSESARLVSAVHRELATLIAVDYFPNAARAQTEAALSNLETVLASRLEPDEPTSQSGAIERQDPAEYQGREWATRPRPWVDRLASAWLIKHFIDPAAQFHWIARSADCPADAIGFDFEGARFTHVGARVTFEVLLASFGLERDPALMRIGTIVHALDVGGAPLPEAPGLAAILGGLKARLASDDQLLAASIPIFDALHARFATAPSEL